jgi:hypothetical protein
MPLTDEDREHGAAMREFNTRLTMMALTRELNNFEQMVSEAVLKDTVKGKDLSIICSLPEGYQRELNRRAKAEAILKLVDGKHVGTVKHRLELNNVRVIHSRMSHKYLRYFNMGDSDGNLVAWWNDTGYELGTSLDMMATVKEHTVWNGDSVPIPMTKLNYVRRSRVG